MDTSPAELPSHLHITSHNQSRSHISHACAECRRRKLKCDGMQPCASCAIRQVSSPVRNCDGCLLRTLAVDAAQCDYTKVDGRSKGRIARLEHDLDYYKRLADAQRVELELIKAQLAERNISMLPLPSPPPSAEVSSFQHSSLNPAASHFLTDSNGLLSPAWHSRSNHSSGSSPGSSPYSSGYESDGGVSFTSPGSVCVLFIGPNCR